jgi:hypothetical protein
MSMSMAALPFPNRGHDGPEEKSTKNLPFRDFRVLFSFMSADADIANDRHGRILAELAGLSLELARDLQNRALEAETPEQAARLAAAFQGVSRGLRQTLALELKVADFRRQQELNARHDRTLGFLRDVPPTPAALNTAIEKEQRRAELSAALRYMIWDEYERGEDEPPEAFHLTSAPHPDVEPVYRGLERFLDVAEARDDFATADLEQQIIVGCMALGLGPSPADLAETEPDAEPEAADTG